MANNPLRQKKRTPQNPHYAWLERTRETFENNFYDSDPAALQGIIAEGQARLAQIGEDDVGLHGYILLALAEAKMNLALESDDKKDLTKFVNDSEKFCSQAIKIAMADTAGTASMILPRALTLLSALYSALPDLQTDLSKKKLADTAKKLDAVLLEQEVLREQAQVAYESAHLLVAGMQGLNIVDRQMVLTEAANSMLKAGNLFSQAGDGERVVRVQKDLAELEEAIKAAETGIPVLAFGSPDPAIKDLMPELEEDLIAEEEQIWEAQAQPNKRFSLSKAISSVGLVISVGMTAFSAYNLAGQVMNWFNFSEEGTQPVETLDERSMTQEAINIQLTVLALEQIPVETAIPDTTTKTEETNSTTGMDDTDEEMLGLDGQQSRNSYSLTDDFSSKEMGWPELDDGLKTLRYEDGAYRFQYRGKGSFDEVFWPVEFIPVEARFEVRAPKDSQDGTFGVLCQYQDRQNYYYVEIDLLTQQYVIAQVAGGEYIPLTTKNISNTYWQPATELKPDTGDTNQFGVTCYPETITFYINGVFVNEVKVQEPATYPGTGAFLVYTFDFAGDEGYTVWFDNVELWEPVQ